MGRTFVFQGVTLFVPDAYSALDLTRLLTPASGGAGIVALVGESDGGAPGLFLFPGGSSTSIIQKALVSGPGADMARMALRSGTDPLVQAGASLLYFFKTNNSGPSASNVVNGGAGPAFTMTTKQYGSFTALFAYNIATVSGSRFLTVYDQNGVPEVSVGVGSAQYMQIFRDASGGAISATIQLAWAGGKLVLTGMNDLGAGPVVAFAYDVTLLTMAQIQALVQGNNPGWNVLIPAPAFNTFLASNLDIVFAAQNCYTATVYGFVASVYELVQWATNSSQQVNIVRGFQNDVRGVPATVGQTAFKIATNGTTAMTTPNVTAINTTGLSVGMAATAANLPAGTQIQSIVASTPDNADGSLEGTK